MVDIEERFAIMDVSLAVIVVLTKEREVFEV
jgi:hypothetical protein